MSLLTGLSLSNARMLMLGLSFGAVLIAMPVVGAAEEQAAQPAEKMGEAPRVAENDEWRENFLRELSALATKLERQRKFNDFLRDRVDILNHRIETLEAENKDQAARLKALDEARSVALDEKDAGKDTESEIAAPEKNEALAPQDKEPEEPPTADDKKGREAGKMPEDFAQFLDLGEAMMRRFFGVVQEFRKEFEDNRV
ncbi:hypothetical protein [uncultured Cohaesibacter sp.]|uniref:hypothetical protein n=1 Tax=uncultured Cohaesibacter sp. TaxID=1002546 RepID=UPI0029C72E5A|nr:hypothetical protein [uncultured Cohaesibacter sp.]